MAVTMIDPHLHEMTVIGAGMAGLTFSALLDRAGVTVPVLEQASALDEIGAGIQLTPRTMSLLDRFGIREELLEMGVEPMAREIRTWNGQPIARTELGNWCTDRYGAPYLTIHRADLQRALLRQAPEVSLGTRVTGIESWPERIRTTLADGTERDQSLLVGADGIRSTVRGHLSPDRPVPSGLVAYRTLVPSTLLPRHLRKPLIRIWVGPEAHAVVYPIRRGEVMNVVAVIKGATAGESWMSDGDISVLLSAYLGWDEQLGTILAHAGATTAWGLHDRDVLARISTDRIALIGDAAHPMLPFAAQGVNQGIEDAWILAHCLIAPGLGDIATRFRRYSDLRAPTAARMQEMARGLGGSLHIPDGPDRRMRDARLAQDAALSRQDGLIAPYGWPGDPAPG
jgi:salicylate hydroxylase